MTLNDLQQTYREEAAKLGEYGLFSKTELANGYCDADEAIINLQRDGGTVAEMVKQQSLRSAYFAALVLRYWYKIFEWMSDSSSLLASQDEYVNWLVDSLGIAFRYRAWRTPYKMKFGKHSHEIEGYELDASGEKIPNPYYWENDPNAPDKIFNRCIFSARGRAYQFANKQKRKDGVHKLSLDELLDEEGDFAAAYTNAYVEDEVIKPAAELIKELLRRGELREALVVDGIANYNTFKTKKEEVDEEVVVQNVFDTRKLVKHLNALDKRYIKHFCTKYEAPAVATAEALDAAYFKEMNNSRIYRCIEKTLQEIKQTPALLDCLL